jgi:rod shape determining protein RodA
MRTKSVISNIDWVLILLFIIFVFSGWVNIYSAVLNSEHISIFDASQKYGKQLALIATSGVLIFIILLTDGKFYERYSGLIYIISMASLIGLFIFGKKVAGATSWYGLGSFSLQPSEFAKFATALALANFLSTPNTNLKKIKTQITAFAIIFLPALIIIPQPDPGSAMVYAAFFFVLYREGLNGNYIFIGFLAAFLFILSIIVDYKIIIGAATVIIIVIAIFRKRKNKSIKLVLSYLVFSSLFLASFDYVYNNVLEDRHRNRLEIMLGIKHDPSGVGYNQHQSMVAIGSGGWSGKGFLEGTQTKGDFVPEQSTDFIFCTVGEEWGFVGSALFILLFSGFIARILYKAEQQKLVFSRVYGYSVAMIFFFHFAINIAMVTGIAPVIGIPLPFYSYGGSSLWGFTILLFIFIKLDSENKSVL